MCSYKCSKHCTVVGAEQFVDDHWLLLGFDVSSEWFDVSSEWFDCTEPSRSNLLEPLQCRELVYCFHCDISVSVGYYATSEHCFHFLHFQLLSRGSTNVD